MIEDAIKPLPTTVSVIVELPAAALAGEIEDSTGVGFTVPMGRVAVFETPPPGDGLFTVMLAAPVVAMLAAGTMTVTCELLT